MTGEVLRPIRVSHVGLQGNVTGTSETTQILYRVEPDFSEPAWYLVTVPPQYDGAGAGGLGDKKTPWTAGYGSSTWAERRTGRAANAQRASSQFRVPHAHDGAAGPGSPTPGRGQVSLRASTARSYAAHIRGYLVPYLGGIPLAALSPGDVQAMFTAIIRDEAALGRSASAATLHRIHATLRAALNGAVRAGLIGVNPGRYPELPRAARPRPQVWTPALTERWHNEGWRPTVGVWTAAQTAQFLRHVRGHRLYALFHLVALRGLRRGEAAGLRWSDLDLHLDAGTLTVSGQLQQLGGWLVAGTCRAAGDRAGQDHDHGPARALRTAAGRAGRRREPVDPDRARVHHQDWQASRAGPDDPPVREAGRHLRTATGHDARAPAWRRHSRPSRRHRPEGRAGPARPLHCCPDRRHLRQRPARNRTHRR